MESSGAARGCERPGNAAARRLGLTPAAVSKSVAQFEARLRKELTELGFRHRIVAAPNPAETPTEGGRDELQDLAAGAQALAPQAQPIAIARDPDLLDQVMDLVFRVEEITGRRCGEAQDRADQALVLIARDRRATER